MSRMLEDVPQDIVIKTLKASCACIPVLVFACVCVCVLFTQWTTATWHSLSNHCVLASIAG